MYMTCTLIYQVKLINTAIDNAKGSSRLRGCIEEDHHDVPLEDCWYARHQLFFTCVMRPKNGRLPKDKQGHTGPDDIVYTLVFFSTFEELNLPMNGPMEDSGVVKLYEPRDF